MRLALFAADVGREAFRGGRVYWAWMTALSGVAFFGIFSYCVQSELGMLVTTGISEEVSWGIYIANFAYLIGIAAAAYSSFPPRAARWASTRWMMPASAWSSMRFSRSREKGCSSAVP